MSAIKIQQSSSKYFDIKFNQRNVSKVSWQRLYLASQVFPRFIDLLGKICSKLTDNTVRKLLSLLPNESTILVIIF